MKLPAKPWLANAIPACRSGSALLISLAVITLLTFLMLAWFLIEQFNLTTSVAYSASQQADAIAQTAIGQVVADFRQEIAVGVRSADNRSTVIPPRVLHDIADTPVDEMDPREFPLFRRSSGDDAALAAAYQKYFPGQTDLPVNLASTVKASTPMQSGRRFINERWRVPRLLPYEPGENWALEPDWVFVTRAGARKTGQDSFDLASAKNLADSSNHNAVIGRYAFLAYDISGLLDINVAGVPSGSLGSGPSVVDKGAPAAIDLDEFFTKSDAGISSDTAETIATWLNPALQSSPSDYFKKIYGTDPAPGQAGSPGTHEKGMSAAPVGSQRFFGRGDLLSFVRSYSANSHVLPGISESDSGVLKGIRTFSKSSRFPAIPETTESDPLFIRAGSDREIPAHDLESGTRKTYQVFEGEAFFQRKFPLSRLRWLSDRQPTGAPLPAYADAIKQHFGLVWFPDLSAATTSPEWNGVAGWVYTSPDSDQAVTSIKSLQMVAQAGREPDFFEWLKAGVEDGSLGVSAGMTNTSRGHQQDISKDFHLIQIGANILDQADPDDVPTLIATGTAIDRNAQPLVAIGVENLPYINEIVSATARDPDNPYRIQTYFQPEIWAPHRNAKAGRPRSSYLSAGGGGADINRFRFRAIEGISYVDSWAELRETSSTDSIIRYLQTFSRSRRTMEPRVLAGESVEFSAGFADYAEPEIAASEVSSNDLQVGGRLVEPGPAPWEVGFIGLKGGAVLAPDPAKLSGAQPGQATVFPQRIPVDELPPGADALKDPRTSPLYTGVNSDWSSLTDTALMSFPIGKKFYNFVVTGFTDTGMGAPFPPGFNPLVNQKLGVFTLEMQLPGGAWVPIQVVEGLKFANAHVDRVEERRDPRENYPALPQPPATRNIDPTPGSDRIVGYNASTTYTPAQKSAGRNFIANGGRPEELAFCKPVLAGWDPDLTGVFSGGDATYLNGEDPFTYLTTGTPNPGAGGEANRGKSRLYFGWMTPHYGSSYLKADPRTRRFGIAGAAIGSPGKSIRPTAAQWNQAAHSDAGNVWDVPDILAQGNSYWLTPGTSLSGGSSWNPPFQHQRTLGTGGRPIVPLAGFGVNRASDLAEQGVVYQDPDGETRLADFAFLDNSEFPTIEDDAAAAANRPVILNRPFRNVAELGTVFRDVPWRSLNFWTGDSADTALLNVFSIEDGEGPGKINPVTASRATLEAILSNTLIDPKVIEANPETLTDSQIEDFVTELMSRVRLNPQDPLGSATGIMPRSQAELLREIVALPSVDPSSDGDSTKFKAEAIARSLFGIIDLETWNILLDVVAQAGRIPPNASDWSDFVARGERRLWVHIAIDRRTGKIIGIQTEHVDE